jgi:hypothetical protein
MDVFNIAIKSLQEGNIEKTINGIRLMKNKSFNTSINGVAKSISISNLPEGYTAILGIDDNDTIRIKEKKIYGKYYIKIYDSFNREISNFFENHRLSTGLDICIKTTNIDSSSVIIKKGTEKLGYFDPEDGEFNITVYDDKPIELSSSKASSTNNSDPSTWWVIGGIIVGVILITLLSYIYYIYYVKSYFPKTPNTNVVTFGKPDTVYNTPRFPPRYYSMN